MIKQVRNCLAEKTVIYCNDGEIKWSYIQSLHALQNTEGSRLANKLSSKHMLWYKHKMRVRPAVQTLSRSVADALEYCNKILRLKEFEGCEATVKFIRFMDRIFDLLNSCSKFGKDFKAPLKPENENDWRPFIREAIDYIDSLCINKQCTQLILHSNRKVGFLGFKVSLLSVQNIFDLYIGTPSLNYMLTYKLSQDHIELFFGLIRQRGGWNVNPTCLQFKAAFKRLLTRNEIKLCQNRKLYCSK